jgi:hypothetical protein
LIEILFYRLQGQTPEKRAHRAAGTIAGGSGWGVRLLDKLVTE